MAIWDKLLKTGADKSDETSNEQASETNAAKEAVSVNQPVQKVALNKTKEEEAIEECELILQSILDGDTSDVQKKLNQVLVKCDKCLSDENDLSKMYTKVCKKLCDEGKDLPIACINSYLEMFTNGLNPKHCESLLIITEAHFKAKYAEEFERGEYGTPLGLYKILSVQLRKKIEKM